MSSKLSRRSFCKKAGIAGAGIGLSGISGFAGTEKSAEALPVKLIRNYKDSMNYRQIGTTGIYSSVFSLGTGKCKDELIKGCLDAGINFIHTSTKYSFGKSIKKVGKAIKGRQDKVHIALKDNFDSIEEALKILGVKHVDFLMFNRHNSKELQEEMPELEKKFKDWKSKGLVKYAGLTCHKQMAGCLDVALKSDLFTCVMPSLGPKVFEDLKKKRDALAKKRISIIGMKTKGELDEKEYSTQIGIVLQDQNVATVNKGLKTHDDLKMGLEAAGSIRTGFLYPRIRQTPESGPAYQGCALCGKCEDVCPNGVAAADIVRCVRYYNDAERQPDTAAENFQELGLAGTLSRCTACGSCEGACPQGIEVRRELKRALNKWVV